MLRFVEFKDVIRRNLHNFLPDEVRESVVIDETVVVKMNDQKLHGLIIKTEGKEAAPTFYMDEMFERYSAGEDMGSLMEELAEAYKQTLSADMPTPPEIDFDYEVMKEKLTVRLLEESRNREFLKEMPYLYVGNGLVLTADINMGEDPSGGWRIAVNNSVLSELGVDEDRLLKDAVENSARIESATLTDMSAALFSPFKENLLERDEPIPADELGGMYVLTNSSGSFGAAALFYPNVKEKAAELLGSDYHILPSSVHEVIIVPDSLDIKAKELCDMVKQANRTVVEDKDILSDYPLHYDKNACKLEQIGQEEHTIEEKAS